MAGLRVLVSGFEAFLEEKVNPTEQIVRYLNSCDAHDRTGWESLDVRGVLLPVLFDEAFRRLEQERVMFNPDIILSFGLAGGRTSIDVERLAVNIRGGDTAAVSSGQGTGHAGGTGHQAPLMTTPQRPDNAGVVGSGTIDVAAPLSLPTALPFEAILEGLKSEGIPAKESFSAGTYVCNDLFFQMQNRLRFTRVRSGFIHVPRLAVEGESATAAAWEWPKLELAVRAILKAVAADANGPGR